MGIPVKKVKSDSENPPTNMCKTDADSCRERHKVYTWAEVKEHEKSDDKWIVIDGHVYDITSFSKRHPGGARVISHHAGQDATDVWTAMHTDKAYVSKFMKPLCIGTVGDTKKDEIVKDFRNLRDTVEKMGLFEANPLFYIGHLTHIILLEILAYYVLRQYGISWLPYLSTILMLATSQSQAGWSQHDYGHLSVFKSNKINHFMHHFVIGQLKGVSSRWWNFRHFQHHSKPNIIKKDPDISLPYVFLLGDKMPIQWAKKKLGFMPYNFQHRYFFFLGPPTLLPIYFHIEVLYFVFKRGQWLDLAWMLSFFVRLFYLYTPLLGFWGTFGMYMVVRFIESHWFTWVTQMSHIPMDIDKENERDWFTLQLKSSCNVEGGLFNDWFTGHLNYQIEHHLFPSMPRHNYHKCSTLVQSMCKKHGLHYSNKSLYTAFADVVRSLQKSGQLWYDAYYG